VHIIYLCCYHFANCRGVASWTWYYPFHYAPMVSDMADIAATPVHFAPGAPFHPFEQLLAVLPAASCKLLPQPFEVIHSWKCKHHQHGTQEGEHAHGTRLYIAHWTRL